MGQEMEMSMINKKSKIFFSLALLILIMTGCGTVPQSYVKADSFTYDAVAPEYLYYVAQDDRLDAHQKELRRRTIMSWQARIEVAK